MLTPGYSDVVLISPKSRHTVRVHTSAAGGTWDWGRCATSPSFAPDLCCGRFQHRAQSRQRCCLPVAIAAAHRPPATVTCSRCRSGCSATSTPRFNAETTGRFSASEPRPGYKVPEYTAAAVRDKQRRDDIQTAELISRGTPTVPIRTDGGMNPIFLAALKSHGGPGHRSPPPRAPSLHMSIRRPSLLRPRPEAWWGSPRASRGRCRRCRSFRRLVRVTLAVSWAACSARRARARRPQRAIHRRSRRLQRRPSRRSPSRHIRRLPPPAPWRRSSGRSQ